MVDRDPGFLLFEALITVSMALLLGYYATVIVVTAQQADRKALRQLISTVEDISCLEQRADQS